MALLTADIESLPNTARRGDNRPTSSSYLDGTLPRPRVFRRALELWSVRRWVAGRLGSVRHERQVARAAAALVRATASLHDLSAEHRRLLRLAAYVHDVGRCQSDATHPRVGATMIAEHRGLPLTDQTRRALMYLTRYHRGRAPAAGRDRVLRPGDDVAGLRLVLAFLRAADALDSRWAGSAGLTVSLRGRRLRIACVVDQLTSKTARAFAKRKKLRLLERELGIDIQVKLREAEPVW